MLNVHYNIFFVQKGDKFSDYEKWATEFITSRDMREMIGQTSSENQVRSKQLVYFKYPNVNIMKVSGNGWY